MSGACVIRNILEHIGAMTELPHITPARGAATVVRVRCPDGREFRHWAKLG